MTDRRHFLSVAPLLGLLGLGGMKPKGLRLSADRRSPFYDPQLRTHHAWCTVDGVEQRHVLEADEEHGWCVKLALNEKGQPFSAGPGQGPALDRVTGVVRIGFKERSRLNNNWIGNDEENPDAFDELKKLARATGDPVLQRLVVSLP